MEASVSRRTFLKGSAGAAALAGLAGASAFDLVPAAHADEAPQTKTCYNSCPRNCYDTCSIVSTVEDGVLKIDVPKKQEQPKLEEKKTIAIEG